jgi:nicotinamidase-related amidase
VPSKRADRRAISSSRKDERCIRYLHRSEGRREVFPKDNEPFVESGVDKFFQTNLEQLLKDKGIKTVIVAGTGSNGAVLYTASSAAMRGLKVVIPLDLVSDVDLYTEQYIAYHFTKVPVLAGSIVLTRSDLIK